MGNRKAFTLIELLVTFVLVILALTVIGSCLGILAGGPGRFVGGINPTYSQSTRVGKIIKFGEKTNFLGAYKSWEGAMQMSDFGLQSQQNLQSSVNGNIWEFSLEETADPALTSKILLSLKEQRPISLTYNQWWSRPATISTEYVITAAEFPEDVRNSQK